MQATFLSEMRWMDLINLIAIVVGPILAVGVDRFRQSRSDDYNRRIGIFRSLMRTRRLRLDPEHVGAINLIDLEFYGRPKVLTAFSSYMDHLSSPVPTTEQGSERFLDQRDDLLIKLLAEMGDDLGLKFDKHDLKKLSYGPIGWETEQGTQKQNMVYFNELLSGKRALPVTYMHQPPEANPFPPPPNMN
ncbi:hypothetical protein SAMN05880582_101593 [Rhizobium sp. RU20A]|uniref:DUF6680 family protein n=1 Tax=Rhizobium sp. RU20A TaxID=1907412 RepID=UPI000954A940|nr:DUF6680 family protein [Rhizobium sp. RU20A]SIQ06548.1 hypothetical protein SAMN05880582_101593 [Rhizobium sp. RU20A]